MRVRARIAIVLLVLVVSAPPVAADIGCPMKCWEALDMTQCLDGMLWTGTMTTCEAYCFCRYMWQYACYFECGCRGNECFFV